MASRRARSRARRGLSALHQGFRAWLRPARLALAQGAAAPGGAYDRPSISASVKAPEMIIRGIGNEPTVLAMADMIGPGPSAPGLAASTSMEMSGSLSMTSR